jgi:hypothetical protein
VPAKKLNPFILIGEGIFVAHFQRKNMSLKCRAGCREKYDTFTWWIFILFLILLKNKESWNSQI